MAFLSTPMTLYSFVICGGLQKYENTLKLRYYIFVYGVRLLEHLYFREKCFIKCKKCKKAFTLVYSPATHA